MSTTSAPFLARLRRRGSIAASALATSALASATLAFAVPASATDLAEVYERAQEYDATLRAAVFDREATGQQLPIARSAFLPQLSVGAELGLGYLDSDNSDGDTFDSSGLSLAASQTLFNRANAALLDQARLGVRQADVQLLAVRQDLILRTASAYFDVLRAQADVEFNQSELEAIGRQREQAERRFDVGLVPVTDVRTAQAQYDLAVAAEIVSSNGLSTAQEALRVISGIDTNLLDPVADDLPLVSPDPTDIDAWVTLAEEQNLELVAARLAAEAAATQIRVERGNRYPTLELVGTGSTSTTTQFGSSDATVAEIALQLELPISTGGLINAQVAQARAQAGAAEEELSAQQRSATQQARDAYRGVQASISQVQALRQALVSTQQSAEATEAGFRAGTRTSIEVLQALRDVFQARSEFVGARYDYLINMLNLKAAAGTLDESDIEAVNRFLVPAEADLDNVTDGDL